MGQKYDVMGQSFEIYNLISSPDLQINSRFIPYYKTAGQVVPTGTMMGELGKTLVGQLRLKKKELNLGYIKYNLKEMLLIAELMNKISH
jgi:hypothetical protein